MSSLKSETDFSTSAYGAVVAMATCCDERHPPEGAIDGNSQEFWATTGCFPQEIVIQLPHSVKAQLITVETVNGVLLDLNLRLLLDVSWGTAILHVAPAAKEVAFESSDDDVPGHFTKLHKKSFQRSTDVQTESHVLQQPLSMQFFKLVINDGWHSFSAVRKYGSPYMCRTWKNLNELTARGYGDDSVTSVTGFQYTVDDDDDPMIHGR